MTAPIHTAPLPRGYTLRVYGGSDFRRNAADFLSAARRIRRQSAVNPATRKPVFVMAESAPVAG